MQTTNSDSVNWCALRTEAGFTLAEAAARSGYSQAAINGLEKHGAGSARLREKLLEIYKGSRLAEPVGIDWRERALTAETELRTIKMRLLELGEAALKSYPKPKAKRKKS